MADGLIKFVANTSLVRSALCVKSALLYSEPVAKKHLPRKPRGLFLIGQKGMFYEPDVL